MLVTCLLIHLNCEKFSRHDIIISLRLNICVLNFSCIVCILTTVLFITCGLEYTIIGHHDISVLTHTFVSRQKASDAWVLTVSILKRRCRLNLHSRSHHVFVLGAHHTKSNRVHFISSFGNSLLTAGRFSIWANFLTIGA